ncbi:MAG TPA: anti-sigma factor [Actinomycetota bacterium]|jgi:hypothetical protein
MRHEEIEELVPLLALDALSPEEELSVRAHVEDCRQCSTLLREHLETAAGLALVAAPAAPSAGLKTRLMAQVTAHSQVAPAPAAPPADASRGRAAWLRVMPSARWRRTIAGLVAACVVLAVVNLVTARRLADQDRQIAEQRQILELISGVPAMTMTPAAPGRVPAGATGHVFVKNGKAAIVLTGLDDSPNGVYEVWVIRGGKPSPLTTAGRPRWLKEKRQAVAVVEGGVQGVDGMAVSLEPAPPPPDASAPRGPILLKT